MRRKYHIFLGFINFQGILLFLIGSRAQVQQCNIQRSQSGAQFTLNKVYENIIRVQYHLTSSFRHKYVTLKKYVDFYRTFPHSTKIYDNLRVSLLLLNIVFFSIFSNVIQYGYYTALTIFNGLFSKTIFLIFHINFLHRLAKEKHYS